MQLLLHVFIISTSEEIPYNSIFDNELGIVILFSEWQYWKASFFNDVTDDGIDISFSDWQYENAHIPIEFTDDGISTCFNELQ